MYKYLNLGMVALFLLLFLEISNDSRKQTKTETHPNRSGPLKIKEKQVEETKKKTRKKGVTKMTGREITSLITGKAIKKWVKYIHTHIRCLSTYPTHTATNGSL